MTPKQQEAYSLLAQGFSIGAIAKKLGIARSSVHDRINGAKKYLEASEGIKDAMTKSGLQDISQLHSGWLKTDEASLYFIQPKETTAQNLDNIIDYVRDAMTDIDPAPIITKPNFSLKKMITIYPIADAHFGMRGEGYDLDVARKRIRQGMEQCITGSLRAEECVILDVGDLTHADDTNYQTPRSKHPLDMDGSQYEALDAAIDTLCTCIEMAAQHHKRVRVRILRGNHNENSYLAVMFALFERYRNEDRIDIERTPSDFFVYRFGKCMFAAHHGDKAKAERLVMHMAHEWAEDWGATKWRYYFTGHLHHAKLQDVGGVQVEQLRAVTGKDAYAASHGYVASPQMQAITYHEDKGEVARIKVNF
jgi:predicted DNA-binding protein YlxM (UPF0122 family)